MPIPFLKYDHKKQLDTLPKLVQRPEDYEILFSPSAYRHTLLDLIKQAKKRIYLIALYLERDEAGQEILEALYSAKKKNPNVDIKIFVDWHRAKRGRIGEGAVQSNLNFYCDMKWKYPNIDIVVYGVPVNRRELFGVLHLKGSIIDNAVLYTGASINNVYLHKHDKYRYDRYHLIHNKQLADSMVNFVDEHLSAANAIQCLDNPEQPSCRAIRPDIRSFRQQLKHNHYEFAPTATPNQLSVSPIIGLGKRNVLNQTIQHLLCQARGKITLCTPYFNLPNPLRKALIRLLKKGIHIEIIVGDKTANDFYIPENEPFHAVGGLPYLYEINLRNFVMKLQDYIDKGLLTIRLWKDNDNSYHLKGIWVDDEWVMITGNNLNPRAWRLDLENGILVHDPKHQLTKQFTQELDTIRKHTFVITHYQQIQEKQFYPKRVLKLIKRLSRIKADKLIKRLL